MKKATEEERNKITEAINEGRVQWEPQVEKTLSSITNDPEELKAAQANPNFLHFQVEGFENGRNDCTGFIVRWGIEKIGGGELTFGFDKDGSIRCDDEMMGRDFAMLILGEMVKRAKLSSDEYNESKQ